MVFQMFYHVMGFIDTIVYGIASATVDVIIELSRTPIFKQPSIDAVTHRVYVVIGVLMLFKLVISAIQYIINPDTFDDKEKGFGGVLQRLAISIVLIVIAPSIFNFLMSVQDVVLEAMPKIILGSATTSDGKDPLNGGDISFEVLSSFIRVKEGHEKDVNGKAGVGPGKQIDNLAQFNLHLTENCPVTLVGWVIKGGDACTYDYMIVISTIAGCFLAWVTGSMALDIGVRAIKLSIIQILAPIPITSYVYSKEKLNKYIKTATTVYLDLFVRFGIIYFIILALQLLSESGLWDPLGVTNGFADTGSWVKNVVVNNTIIFALLHFAKKAPKFLSELLGLPDISSGEMAEMFKPIWKRSGGLAVIGGFVAAGAANMANKANQAQGSTFGERLRNTMKDKEARRAMWKSGAAGAASAGFHGGVAAMQGKDGTETWKAGYKRAIQARTDRLIDQSKGLTGIEGMKTRAKVAIQDYMGLTSTASLANDTIKATDTAIQDSGALKGKYMELLGRYGNMVNINHSTAAQESFKSLANRYESAFTNPIYGSAVTPEMLSIVNRMQTGGKVSYDEVSALKDAIKSSEKLQGSVELQRFANELEDQHETMKGITAEFMKESMASKVDYMDGVRSDQRYFTRSADEFDKDLELRIKTEEQHLAENAASLVGTEFTFKYENPDGTIRREKKVLTTADDFSAAFNNDFKALEGAVKKKGNDARESLASDTEAAARAANQRHSENKNKNG